MAPGGRFDEAGLLAAAAYTPEVLDHMGYRAPTLAPIVTLPNGVALHRWPAHYLTSDVTAFVALWRSARGTPIGDGGLLGWPAWLVAAVGYLNTNKDLEAAHG